MWSADAQRLLLTMFVGAIAYAKWQAAKQPPVPVGHTLAGFQLTRIHKPRAG